MEAEPNKFLRKGPEALSQKPSLRGPYHFALFPQASLSSSISPPHHCHVFCCCFFSFLCSKQEKLHIICQDKRAGGAAAARDERRGSGGGGTSGRPRRTPVQTSVCISKQIFEIYCITNYDNWGRLVNIISI